MVQVHQSLSRSLTRGSYRGAKTAGGFRERNKGRSVADGEIRLSRRVDCALVEAYHTQRALDLFASNLYTTEHYYELLKETEATFEAVVYHGAPTEPFRKWLEEIRLEWRKFPLLSNSEIIRGERFLTALTKAADTLDERDPRELPFIRQMEVFIRLIVLNEFLDRSHYYAISRVSKWADFNPRDAALLIEVVNAREKVFKGFSKRALGNYCSKFKILGLRAGLSEATMGSLEDELLIELSWFHG